MQSIIATIYYKKENTVPNLTGFQQREFCLGWFQLAGNSEFSRRQFTLTLTVIRVKTTLRLIAIAINYPHTPTSG